MEYFAKGEEKPMIGGAYVLVVIGILLAKGLGFFRDMVFAGVFGTGAQADIYSQVFGLVNLIFTGIGVALSTLVIKCRKGNSICCIFFEEKHFLAHSCGTCRCGVG